MREGGFTKLRIVGRPQIQGEVDQRRGDADENPTDDEEAANDELDREQHHSTNNPPAPSAK